MSLTSRILIKFLQLSGIKGKLAKGSQKTFEEAVSYNRKHPFIMPKDHKAIYEQIDIHTSFGIYPCVKITQPDSCRNHAVLFTWVGEISRLGPASYGRKLFRAEADPVLLRLQ